jgi:hypothetical protein
VELIETFGIKKVLYTGDDGIFHSWNDPIPFSAYEIMKNGKINAGKPLNIPNYRLEVSFNGVVPS